MPLLLLTDSNIPQISRLPPAGRNAPMCVNAAWPSLSSQRDHTVQMEGGLIKLTWVSEEGKDLCILLHMWWLHCRNEGLVEDENEVHVPQCYHPTHVHMHILSCTDLRIRMGGKIRREFHRSFCDSFYITNFMLWWCLNATTRSCCTEKLWLASKLQQVEHEKLSRYSTSGVTATTSCQPWFYIVAEQWSYL